MISIMLGNHRRIRSVGNCSESVPYRRTKPYRAMWLRTCPYADILTRPPKAGNIRPADSGNRNFSCFSAVSILDP